MPCLWGFYDCFPERRLQGGGMSLNRNEQMLCDYVVANADERHFWEEKVRARAKESQDRHAVSASLAEELWRYFEERSGVVEPFRGQALRDGLSRTSMRNLADLWLRQWAPIKTKAARTPTYDGY
jgi:hypothetical protein